MAGGTGQGPAQTQGKAHPKEWPGPSQPARAQQTPSLVGGFSGLRANERSRERAWKKGVAECGED